MFWGPTPPSNITVLINLRPKVGDVSTYSKHKMQILGANELKECLSRLKNPCHPPLLKIIAPKIEVLDQILSETNEHVPTILHISTRIVKRHSTLHDANHGSSAWTSIDVDCIWLRKAKKSSIRLHFVRMKTISCMAKGDLAKGLNQRDKASRGRFLSSCVTVKLKEIVLDIVLHSA